MTDSPTDTQLDTSWALAWARGAASAISEHVAELGELDTAIGDGDHGTNLERGFSAVLERLDADAAALSTPGQVLRTTATALMSSVGGASGPLLGSALLRASRAAGDKPSLTAADAAKLLAEASDGLRARGRAEAGEKTMADAWVPAAKAAQEAADSGATAAAVLAAAAEAAEAGAASTDAMVARKGRASYLGARSVGHRDPGAASSALVIRAAADAATASR